jgi:predicted HAD superfamily Cof-like phosphohydrolase
MSSENYYIEQVEHFNNVFGKLNNEKPTLVNEKEAQFIYDFIKEELDEYMQAYKNGDIVEVADAFGDIMYVLSAGILAFGLKDKFKTLFDEIQASNMSKACNTEDDAKQTSTSITTIKGIETHHEKVGDKYIVYRSSDRKVQKNIKYFRPNLKQFFNDEDLKRTSNDTKIGQSVNS